MSRSIEEWRILARTYLAANAGRQLPGMTHNVNNLCHVLEMQLELFQNKIERDPTLRAEELVPKFSRLTQAVDRLAAILRDNEQHSFYTEEDLNIIDISLFITWLNRFWSSNLFFKHKLTTNILCADNLPEFKLPPFILTLSMDEAIKNAVEACSANDPNAQQEITLQIAPLGQGAAFMLTSPTAMPSNLDPWQEGSTSKPGHLGLGLPMVKALAEQVGWSVDLTTEVEKTTFRLEISEQKMGKKSVQ
ncbi:MAG: GHKL domain-containing protein [Desulfoplanes sp.]